MRQRLEIIVITEVDHDKVTMNNGFYEKDLQCLIAEAVKKSIGTPKVRTECFFEYGDPL